MASDPDPVEIELWHTLAERLRPNVPDAVADAVVGADPRSGRVEESGQFHRVLVVPDVAVLRMTRLQEAGAAPGSSWSRRNSPAAHLPRRMRLLEALAAQRPPFALPEPLTEVVCTREDDEPLTAAVLQRFVPGQAHPPHDGDPATLRWVLDALAAVDVTAPELAPQLSGPHDFRGPWTDERVERVLGLPRFLVERDVTASSAFDGLPRPWEPAVRAVLDRVRRWHETPPVTPGLVHGDLAGHNMLWQPRPGGRDTDGAPGVEWRLRGVLDWDLAHAGDPARNLAYLGLWHGERQIDAVAASPTEAARARVWLAAASLDALDDARARHETTGRPLRWAKLLRTTLPRIVHAAAR